MEFEDLDRAFTPPAATDLVAFRAVGSAMFATVTSDAISSIEIRTLAETLHAALAQSPQGLSHFVLDLEQVDFINSQAISMFITLHSTVKSRNAKLILASVRESLLEVFVVSNLQKLLTVCVTHAQLEEALR